MEPHPVKKNYQLGTDAEWLQHSNEELAQVVKRRNRQLALLRLLAALLVLGWAWTLWKYSQHAALTGLLEF